MKFKQAMDVFEETTKPKLLRLLMDEADDQARLDEILAKMNKGFEQGRSLEPFLVVAFGAKETADFHASLDKEIPASTPVSAAPVAPQP